MTLDHTLERTVTIRARRATVFRFFTDPSLFAQWWGEGSLIEGRPGGVVTIRYPNGVAAAGQVVEIVPDERVVFTYGYDAADKGLPPGASRVTVTLEETRDGTRLTLRHDLPSAAMRDAHVPGWRYQLALFANAAARVEHADAATTVDRYLALWSEPDERLRRQTLDAIATPDMTFGDAFACTDGREDLAAHIGATQQHMPGLRLQRQGDVRQCQGVLLADWAAIGPDGAVAGRGTNVFLLAPDGRLSRATGFWG